jgi:hypothetical protein
LCTFLCVIGNWHTVDHFHCCPNKLPHHCQLRSIGRQKLGVRRCQNCYSFSFSYQNSSSP